MTNANKCVLAISLLLISISVDFCAPTKTPFAQNTRTAPTAFLAPSQNSADTPDASPIATDGSRLVNRCVKVLQNSDLKLSGVLAVITYREGVNSYLLNLETKSKINLGHAAGFSVSVSPDRKKVAFSDLNQKALILTDVNGIILNTIVDPNLVMQPTGWLDNNRLTIDKHRPTGPDEPQILDALDILNPITRETREFLPNYPHIYNIPGEVKWGTQSRLTINPGLSFLVYPALDYETPAILWDIGSSREVTRVHWADLHNTPQWSLDGTHFVVSAPVKYVATNKTFVNVDDGLPYVGGNELLEVNLTGQIKRLTFLTTQYAAEEDSYTWSPDEQYVAFTMRLKESGNNHYGGQLGILNVKTGQIINYCISGQYLAPIWSPNGKQLALDISVDGVKDQVFVMDIAKGIAVRVADDAVAQGWMVPGK